MRSIGLETIKIEGRVWCDGYFKVAASVEPFLSAVVPAGYVFVYARDDGAGVTKLYYKDDAQAEHAL